MHLPMPHGMRSLLRVLCLAAVLASSPASADPLSVDPDFNAGRTFVDAFANESPGKHFHARKVAHTTGGDSIVAGLVAWGTQNGPDGEKMNIGLVRYDANGTRIAWGSGADGPYTHFNRQYLVYPKTSSLFTRVVDMAIVGNTVYVLADRDSLVNCAPGCARSVSVLAFRLSDGGFVGIETVFGSAFDEYGAGILPLQGGFSGYSLLMAGTRVLADGRRQPILRRFNVASGTGALVADEGFAPSGFRELTLPPGLCSGACDASLARVAMYGGGFVPIGLYLGGDLHTGPDTTEYLVLRIDPNGNLVSGFGNGGAGRYLVTSLIQPDQSMLQGRMAALVVVPGDFLVPNSDAIYFAGQGDGNTRNYIVKVRGDGTREMDYGFRYSSSTASTFVHNITDMHAVGEFLYTVGQEKFFQSDPGDAKVARVPRDVVTDDSLSGHVRIMPALRADGSRWGEGGLRAATVLPDGRLVAVGDVNDDTSSNARRFGTYALCMTNACRLFFGDGFED